MREGGLGFLVTDGIERNWDRVFGIRGEERRSSEEPGKSSFCLRLGLRFASPLEHTNIEVMNCLGLRLKNRRKNIHRRCSKKSIGVQACAVMLHLRKIPTEENLRTDVCVYVEATLCVELGESGRERKVDHDLRKEITAALVSSSMYPATLIPATKSLRRRTWPHQLSEILARKSLGDRRLEPSPGTWSRRAAPGARDT